MAKRLIPLLDRVLVEKFVPPSKSVGGVLLPESATQKVSCATGAGRGDSRWRRVGGLPRPTPLCPPAVRPHPLLRTSMRLWRSPTAAIVALAALSPR